MKKYDVIIVGAGPAGLSFANALSQTDCKIAVLEAQSEKSIAQPKPDGREIALTHLSLKIMKELSIWQKTPKENISLIKKAKVFDGDSDYALNFDTQKSDLEELGYMVPNFSIRKACFDAIQDKQNISLFYDNKVNEINAGDKYSVVTLENGERFKAQLVVGADSRFSATRRMMGISADMHDFGRSAIVCRMRHDKSHEQTASECFHYERTLAVLPLNNDVSSIVITLKSNEATEVLAMTKDEFNQDVMQRFGRALGDMQLIGERFNYPLVATFANKFYAHRFALIGDAAVGMHPVTAHGFNLGLRSAYTLSELIIQTHNHNEDIASNALLRKYNRKHRVISRPIYLGTNGIVSLFTNDKPLAKMLRKGVLRFGNRFPPVKKFITHQLTEDGNTSLLRSLLPY